MPAIFLNNADLNFEIQPERGTWSVNSHPDGAANLSGVQMGVSYQIGRTAQKDQLTWRRFSAERVETINTPLGAWNGLILQAGFADSPLSCQITFALAQSSPLLLWKVAVTNRGSLPVQMQKIELLRVGFVTIDSGSPPHDHPPAGKLQLHPRPGEYAFYSNGWQSWNYSGVYRYYEHFRRSRLGWLTRPFRVNAGTPYPRGRGHFASDFFGVLGDRIHRTGLLVGFLSQQQHFGSLEAYLDPFEPALRMWANGDLARLDPGKQIETDWACLHFLHLDTPDSLEPYLTSVATTHGLGPEASLGHQAQALATPTGWCSWYQYYQKISPDLISQNIQAANALQSELPLQLIQIDDGFEAQVGDWLNFNAAFPQGMAPIAAEIQRSGFMPGIWLAPFIQHPRSRILHEHPDWMLRTRRGRLVNAGFVWFTFTHALDLTHPEAFDYARQVVHTAANEWGYDYLKLDFLYAAALPGQYRDQTKTRAQVLRQGLQALRDAAGPDKTLLGCGCPLGPAIGLVDSMRVSADVAPNWHPREFNTHFFIKSEPDHPSTRNAIHNTLTRAQLHRRWWVNDPDCLLVRPNSLLTLAEIQTLATAIAMSGGSLLLSDELTSLPQERRQIAEVLLPLIGQRPHVIDWFDNPTPGRLQLDLVSPAGRWHLVALFNWLDQSAEQTLRSIDFYLDSRQTYLVREFWSGNVQKLVPEGEISLNVAPHGCLLYALHSLSFGPQYLGSSLHISQGLEVSEWNVLERSVRFSVIRPGLASGLIDLHLPWMPSSIVVNGQPQGWEDLGEEIYRLQANIDKQAIILVQAS
jgi:alpha-galactosidase